MPLTKKGNKIMGAMQDKYGEEKGEKIFYASKNKGTISGVEKAKTGKAFGPPPKSGPQPQGIKKAFLGGMSNYMKINRFLDSVVYPTAIKTKLAHENERRKKRAQQNLEKQKQISQAYDYLGKEYGPPKNETQLQGMNGGGSVYGNKMNGCPHRETGAQSNIKGVKAIQKTGEKFTGVK